MDKIIDYISGNEVEGTPEEIAAVQPFSKILVEDYGYPKEMIVTHPQYRVKSHPSDKRGYPIDIAVFEPDENGTKKLKIVVENKRPERNDGITQLKDYLKFCDAQIGIWFNGQNSAYIKKIEHSGNISFEEIPAFPKYKQKLSEIGKYRRKDLKPTHNLKEIFSEMRGHIVGNSVGVNRDEEIAKEVIHLILCKIYDERFTRPEDMVKFRVSEDDSPAEIKNRIDGLFKSVKAKYSDVLSNEDTISFDGETLRYIIGKIQNYCFQETDRDTISDAFEVFIGYSLKGSQGQFFTPKNVIRTLVAAVNPQKTDTIIDPSCGSCGFLVESLKHIWEQIDYEAEEYRWTDAAKEEEKRTVAIKNIRGIEKDSFLTKVGKSYMAILGDGKGGIFCEDSLEIPSKWKAMTRQNVRLGGFDISFSNPPFGKDIKVTGKEKLSQYELAYKDFENKTGLVSEGNVSTLFLERNLQLLKTKEDYEKGDRAGILAIILPETYFHAPSRSNIRRYIYRNNIKWIIDLPHNTFRPHNNAKCIARVKDIVNWQIYTDPTALIPQSEFDRLYRQSKALHPKDILYVRRGSYRIGSVAMVSPYDIDVILTREILVLRLEKSDNPYGITPEYLLYALSHNIVQEQAVNKVFIDTTLPNIAERWKELLIPVLLDETKMNEIKQKAENVIQQHWSAAEAIHEFKDKYGVYNT